jgi:NADPH:quinone reductase-like Zn-dependent oxidoreductase
MTEDELGSRADIANQAVVRRNGRYELEEIPWPKANEGDIIVRVAFGTANEWDDDIRKGHVEDYIEQLKAYGPCITGFELAGTVIRGNDEFQPGDAVIGMTDVLAGPPTHQTIIAIKPEWLVKAPRNVSLSGSVATLNMAMTAIEGLENVFGAKAGHKVLVVGASGGVERYLATGGMYMPSSANRDPEGQRIAESSDRNFGKLVVLAADKAGLAMLSRRIESGEIVPAVDRIYPASQANDAVDHISRSGRKGRVVIAFE